jgi:hypothetical protein
LKLDPQCRRDRQSVDRRAAIRWEAESPANDRKVVEVTQVSIWSAAADRIGSATGNGWLHIADG